MNFKRAKSFLIKPRNQNVTKHSFYIKYYFNYNYRTQTMSGYQQKVYQIIKIKKFHQRTVMVEFLEKKQVMKLIIILLKIKIIYLICKIKIKKISIKEIII